MGNNLLVNVSNRVFCFAHPTGYALQIANIIEFSFTNTDRKYNIIGLVFLTDLTSDRIICFLVEQAIALNKYNILPTLQMRSRFT